MTIKTTATDARESLSEKAEQQGWQRTRRERVDVYGRGIYQVHAIWRDNTTMNGGARYEDAILLAYTTEPAKLQSWLAR
ncbi:hypothetical protein AWC18_03985 [Mycolicibacter nonchromogenicus]|uniref:Uncharacterized protein n=1 Tax=Mycolicibacter nonchromogenicus TaxID=1782 RepID=A0A1X1ZKP5_MYCNO|nr:hypothetical protein [Mycolicibacter nonchromogenicus]ORW23855.1 hypothetical protein AWC18_03985 [Mycolicibacter nonchromogenicus]